MPSPRRFSNIFYGWWIVGACFIIALYMSGVIFYGFTAIFEPIAEEFGWSYTSISIAASIRGLEAGMLAPVVGILVDRWGPRRVIFIGVLLMGLGLMLLSQVHSLLMFYIAFILMSLGISSCGISVTVTAVANWFHRRVGLASGIMICGYGSSGLLVPLVVRLVDLYDWRTAIVIMSIGMFVIGLPLSLLLRHKPEQYGYLPDGGEARGVTFDSSSMKLPAQEISISARQAMKTRVFWLTVLAVMPQFIVIPAVITHVMPYLSSLGFTRTMSGLVATAIPLLSISGRFGFGWLADKYVAKRLSTLALIMLALGLICFEYVSLGWIWLLVPFLVFLGFGYGGINTMVGVLLRGHFGRGNFGTIIGFAWGILMVGTMVGPPIAGWVFDHWGSYQGTWVSMAGGAFIGAIIMTMTPRGGEQQIR
ncbi:MAG TPA: MFS transporter [Dehalococcoidia bacterium]|nr:MFS transporter [Dehalococcoidia bacterium]